MEPVNSLEHFSALVSEAKSIGKILFTNCYLLPDGINKYIRQNRMFWEKISNGIIFLCEERDFFYLYFFFIEQQDQGINIKFEKCNKPVVIDLVYSESNKAQALSEVVNIWVRSDFCVYKKYRRMSLVMPSSEEVSKKITIFDGAFYKIAYAKPEDQEDIQNLWRQSLDIFSTALPGECDLLSLLKEKQLFGVYDKDRKIVAALQYQRNGKSGIINHVVVEALHRQKGLAQALLQTCISSNKGITKYCLWVEENNAPATKFYIKNGFSFDGKISDQLILMN